MDNPETDLMVNGMGYSKVLEHAHLVGVNVLFMHHQAAEYMVQTQKCPLKNMTYQ